MSDDCGVMQHSRFGAPDRSHGYCTDDNSRALSLMARLAGEGSLDAAGERLGLSCAAFLNHAWSTETGRFRNFMGFDRRWLDEGGSDDCCARALEALCLVARDWPQADLRDWAGDLAREVIQHTQAWTSLRSRALVIKALLAAEHSIITEPETRRLVAEAAGELLRSAQEGASDHGWFEPNLSYDNARLPEALILAGERLQDADMLSAGINTLDLLMKQQITAHGFFAPVPTSAFAETSADHIHFDQQPIEALATVDACIAGWRATGSTQYAHAARQAFEWFGGRNVHGVALARPSDGICCDALTIDGLNRNHGAESILSYLLAAASVRRGLLGLPSTAG
jgi:hypothetical protein